MSRFEYKVVPAPKRSEKVKGVKGSDALFAHTLESLMNELGAQGWEYQRADTLPSEERSGFTSKTTVFQNVLVFRRALDIEEEVVAPVPSPIAEPETVTPVEAAVEKAGNAPPVGPAVPPEKPSDKSTVAAE